MGERLFTDHIRDDCPLEPLLRERSRTARANAESVGLDRVQGTTVEALVNEICADWSRFAQPLNIVGSPETPQEPQSAERHEKEGSSRFRYWRWSYRVGVDGDIEILERWPRLLERPPLSGDDQLHPALGPLLRSADGSIVIVADVPYEEDPDGSAPPVD